jgi:hypothetical protein
LTPGIAAEIELRTPPKQGQVYEIHWADIEGLGDWNESPERWICPFHVNYYFLAKPWDPDAIQQVFATTKALGPQTLHDHVLIPTGAIVMIRTLAGRTLYKHRKYTA